MSLLALALLIAHAQELPPAPADPRIQTLRYAEAQVIPLQVALGFQLTLMFEPGEKIESVAIGDGSAWQAIANARGDHLFLKPLREGSQTNLTVVTDARVYLFDLAAGGFASGAQPYLVRFTYQDPPGTQEIDSEPAVVGRYRLDGDRDLRPMAISDDGVRTFIEWREGVSLPAVYALDDRGDEVLADGDMIDGQYVLTRVYPRLRFRLGRDRAGARRVGEDR